jgi:hypothetical protein
LRPPKGKRHLFAGEQEPELHHEQGKSEKESPENPEGKTPGETGQTHSPGLIRSEVPLSGRRIGALFVGLLSQNTITTATA